MAKLHAFYYIIKFAIFQISFFQTHDYSFSNRLIKIGFKLKDRRKVNILTQKVVAIPKILLGV